MPTPSQKHGFLTERSIKGNKTKETLAVASGKTGPLVALCPLSHRGRAAFPLILPTEGTQDPAYVIGVIFHPKGPTNDRTNTMTCPLIGS